MNFPAKARLTTNRPIPATGKSTPGSFGILVWLALAGVAWAGENAALNGTITLAWNPSSSANPVGYAVYFGSTSGTCTNRMDAGTNSSLTLTGLIPGSTNYLAVVTYDTTGFESLPSPLVTCVVPIMMQGGSVSGSGGLFATQFPVMAGHWYEVQASTDLRTWTAIYRTAVSSANAAISFTDPQSKAFSSRFYRLVIHSQPATDAMADAAATSGR